MAADPPGDPRRTGPSGGDGRNISNSLGLLGAEAAGQVVPAERTGEGALPSQVWPGPPPDGRSGSQTYYDRPLLKEPVWIWAVPVYFFCGGAAGAVAVLGEAVRLLGPEEDRALSARCRWVSAAGTAAGTILLIYDLGRPDRFFNMLRVFRPTSAMSMGSWILAASGTASAGAAALTPAHGRRTGFWERARPLSDTAAAASAVLGPPLAAYTGVLLSDTAVPLWQQVHKTLPALFVSSAAASAAAVLKLTGPDKSGSAVVRAYGIAGAAAEIFFAFAFEKQAGRVERVGRPLKEGLPSGLWKASKGLSAASLAFALVERGSRFRRLVSGVSGIAGGLALRFAVFLAGKKSAQDPRATFEQQRSMRDGTPRQGSRIM
jgi:formate-dependent nitrite reductase membrane component NrfD